MVRARKHARYLSLAHTYDTLHCYSAAVRAVATKSEGLGTQMRSATFIGISSIWVL